VNDTFPLLLALGQSADGGWIDVEAPRDLGLRLACLQPRQCLSPLMQGQLVRRADLTPIAFARRLPSPVRARISSRSNSAIPASMVISSLPCAVVVSAQVSASDLKPAPVADRIEDVEQVPSLGSVTQRQHRLSRASKKRPRPADGRGPLCSDGVMEAQPSSNPHGCGRAVTQPANAAERARASVSFAAGGRALSPEPTHAFPE
jgi:hypothetical protein